MSRLLTLQDDSGGFELVGSAIKITGGVADIYDLKKVLTSNGIHLVVGTFLRTEMTNVKQSTVFATCAVSSWFCLRVQCCAFS